MTNPKLTNTSVTVTLSLSDKEQLLTRAQTENRSLRQMARLLVLAGLKESAQSEPQRHSTSVAAR